MEEHDPNPEIVEVEFVDLPETLNVVAIGVTLNAILANTEALIAFVNGVAAVAGPMLPPGMVPPGFGSGAPGTGTVKAQPW